jgi:hypothetical protein
MLVTVSVVETVVMVTVSVVQVMVVLLIVVLKLLRLLVLRLRLLHRQAIINLHRCVRNDIGCNCHHCKNNSRTIMMMTTTMTLLLSLVGHRHLQLDTFRKRAQLLQLLWLALLPRPATHNKGMFPFRTAEHRVEK